MPPQGQTEGTDGRHCATGDASASRLKAILQAGGIKCADELFALCCSDDEKHLASLALQAENVATRQLLLRMLMPEASEFSGFFLLNIAKAVDNEEALSRALQESFGDATPLHQMAAFKANHSLELQRERLRINPNAGLEVASLPEVVAACSIGFRPKNIIFID